LPLAYAASYFGQPTSTLLIISFEAVKLKAAEELQAAKEAKQEAVAA
jgi:hypothetical protein